MSQSVSSIARSDYRPPAYWVDTVDLDIRLAPEATEVRSILSVRRNREQPPGPLLLMGEAQARLSVAVEGVEWPAERLTETETGIALDLAGMEQARIEVVSRCNPAANRSLSGLYMSRGGYFTQCEAEGFRRITYYPDRPDVMARFTVRLEADLASCPVLLSNGNLIEAGRLPGGRHFTRWEDPFPKPCYLFALVAAKLVAIERQIETASGRPVLLQVWVEEGFEARAEFAMASLVRALRWDEARFGLELDLERYMIVATSDFNMGAMENKGLNIFNAKYVLADPETATDSDFEHVESVVAHEYFHNWTGNRVTCRDWFQLTLKEGLTVFRDQLFSADMLAEAAAEAGEAAAASARAVKRIDDVRVLRSAQFPEDAGPMAHPIRPEQYSEINNFYTATVYEKGAEVIRMLHTLLGPEGFRNGMDLYFSYFDGKAVTCDDFVEAMAEANGVDLSDFMRWYGQAGTPRVHVAGQWHPTTCRYELVCTQHTPDTPGQTGKDPLVIPLAVGLIGPDGKDLTLQLEGETRAGASTRVLVLRERSQRFVFEAVDVAPVLSVLRGASAPVIVDRAESAPSLAFRLRHDSDPFCRWDAGQRLAQQLILGRAARPAGQAGSALSLLLEAWQEVLRDDRLEPAFKAQVLSLPAEAVLLEAMDEADPLALRAALADLTGAIGREMAQAWRDCWQAMRTDGPYRYHPHEAGRRSLANLALRYLCAGGEGTQAGQQFRSACNMTERMGALVALVNGTEPGAAQSALDDFAARHAGDALVMDKWFAVQAAAWRLDAAMPAVRERVLTLSAHPAFSFDNPNKVYALFAQFFRANPGEFHDEAGEGYALWVNTLLRIDAANPQVAARLARALEQWRRFAPTYRARMASALREVAAARLSPDVAEIVTKALG